jgi:ankyrin repeat protein
LRKPVWQTVTNRKERSAQIFLRARNFQESGFILFSPRASIQSFRCVKTKKKQHQMSKRKNENTEDGSEKKIKEEPITTDMLTRACQKGALDIVRKAIQQKINLEIEASNGFTPLGRACLYGKLKIVKELLDHGANMETRAFGSLPLYWACSRGHIGTVKELIKRGVNLENHNNSCATTALDKACHKNNLNVVQHLIKSGAMATTSNIYGDTPLHTACKLKHLAIVRELLNVKSIDLNAQNHKGQTAFFYAIWSESDPIVRLLIQHRVDIGITTTEGDDALSFSVFRGRPGVVELILQAMSLGMLIARVGKSTPHSQQRTDEILQHEIQKRTKINASAITTLLLGRKDPNSPLALVYRDLMGEIIKEMKAVQLQ